MKLKNKALIVIGLTSLLFLAAVLFFPFSSAIATTLTVVSSSVILLSIYTLIINRVEKLNNEVSSLYTNEDFTKRILIGGNDEISSIGLKINSILDDVQLSQEMLEKQVHETAKDLNNINLKLQQEISARTRNEKVQTNLEYLKQLGRNDELTSLPNGVFFNEILNKAITYSQRRNQNLAVLLIDLDLFKLVDETFGKDKSDLVLKEIGKRFTNVLRQEDILAKLDGDEFVVLLNDIAKPKFASMVAEKLLRICSQLLKIDTHEFTLTASIGISVFPHDGNSLEELFENADRALFKAKQAGGNTYQFFTEDIQVEALEYIQLESALRKAIHNNELALYYQPKFRINTGNIAAVEALMRWEHPVLGIISPVKFIQLAEDSGLIMQIGEWALREACQRITYWQNEGYEHITIALKLSHKQFQHPDMINMLHKVFTSINVNPQYIELEITEQTVMENVELAASILEKIKAFGVQLSIDHFGKGYTSISYLKQLPISAIKIDQSYIKGIPNNPDDVAITNAVIGLAHNLGLEVVAEGVETAEQVQYLSAQSCDLIQGYFLGHPVSAQKIVLQLKKLQDEVLI